MNQKLLTKLFFLLLALSLQSISSLTFAQSIEVKGFVFAADEPSGLIGVNVVVSGTQGGTTTEFDGTFSLELEKANLPDTLLISYTGYADQEIVITQAETNLRVKMEESSLIFDVVEVKGQRIDEKRKASALTVEALDAIAIKQTASADFYDGLGALKGVDLTSASLGIKVVNTRGFNSTAPVRILQVIDGVDNAAPSINFALGNFLGAPEIDLRGVELVVGASSAFYGPNAFNGVIKMTSQDPFYTEGLSISLRGAERNIREGAIRWADSFKNKDGLKNIAYKLYFEFLEADDWVADNFASVDSSEVDARENHYAGYDAVNRYGDEYHPLLDFRFAGSPWTVPGITVFYREGYQESDLLEYDTENYKVGGMFTLRTKPQLEGESPELTFAGNFAQGSTIFQGATRFRLEDVRFYTARLEYAKRNKFFLRAYMTHDEAGNTYNPFVTALKLNELQAQDAAAYSNAYTNVWIQNFGFKANEMGFPRLQFVDGQIFFDEEAQAAFYQNPENLDSLASWHQQTQNIINTSGIGLNPRLIPGTQAFDDATARINSTFADGQDFDLGGSRLFTHSELYHVNGEYTFTPTFLDKLVVGASGRYYTPDTKGTIFDDRLEQFTSWEFGAYAGIDKKLWGEKVTFSLTGRVDKNQRFDWIGTPAASIVLKPSNKDYIRVSFSSAIRNPTVGNQFDHINLGPATLLGNIGGFKDLIEIESFEDYGATLDPETLVFFDVAPIQPEKVRTFEMGYRSTFWDALYVDASYYYNRYDQFIGFLEGLDVAFNELGLPTRIDAYRVTANSQEIVTTHGAAIGLNYYFGTYYQLSGNYTWSKLITDVNDEIIPAFNTPEHKFNVSISGRDVPIRVGGMNAPNFGFNINWKWVEAFIFEGSPQFTGLVPSFGLLDAQINYNFKRMNTTVKIGASNILDNKHLETVGGPFIGRLAYVRVTYQWENKK